MGITAKIQALRTERGKAISHKPTLAGREHLTSQYADSIAPIMEEYADYAKVYQVYSWVHKALALKAEALAPLPVAVVDEDGKAIPEHDVSLLLAYINDTMTPADFWQAWTIHMHLAGESFFELLLGTSGRPAELWPRRPDGVLIRPDASPERALYPRVAEYVWGDDEVTVPWDEMVHDKFYNPLSVWRGLAPITAIREGISIDLFAQAWSKLFLKRGARPDFGVIAPQGLTSTEKEEIESKLMTKLSGPDNWHRPLVLEDGVTDIKPFSFPPKDLEWLEQRKFARDEVAAVFGVPDEIMGYGRDTYENFDTAHKVFWLLTIVPLIQHRDRSLTHFFSKVRPTLEAGQVVQTDLSGVGVLQEDIAPKLEQASQLWALGVPFNDIDERLGLGVGPIPGGEIGYLPFSVVPVGQAGQAQRQALPPAQEQRLFPVPQLEAKAGSTNPRQYGSPEHLARWKAYEKRRGPFERRMQRQLKRDFQDQQIRCLRNLRDGKGAAYAKALWDTVQEKRESVTITVDDMLDWPDEIRRFIETYEAMLEDAVKEFGEAALDNAITSVPASIPGMAVAFDIRNPLLRDAIQEMTIQFAKDITQTTQDMMADELREILLEAEEGGWGIPRIQDQIYERISTQWDVRKSDYQTERIARTEMVKASNMGSLEGMRQSEVVERKGWLAALDGRERATHAQAHHDYSEQGIPLEQEFQVGRDSMLFPGGGGVPGENIN